MVNQIDLENDEFVKSMPIIFTKWLGRLECKHEEIITLDSHLRKTKDGIEYIDIDIEEFLHEYKNK